MMMSKRQATEAARKHLAMQGRHQEVARSVRIEPYGPAAEPRRIGMDEPMKTIVADPNLVAYCGLYCGSCRAYLSERCPGCHANEKAKWCKIRTCCIAFKYATCASCAQFADPQRCKKFNTIVSKFFALVFRSDRRACIEQVRRIGLQGHAADMANQKRQTIRR